MANYVYYPQGVCSQEFRFDIKDDIVNDVEIIGGCAGNLLGIRAFMLNQPISMIIDKLEGICCKQKPTSCPDQIAIALKSFQEENRVVSD